MHLQYSLVLTPLFLTTIIALPHSNPTGEVVGTTLWTRHSDLFTRKAVCRDIDCTTNNHADLSKCPAACPFCNPNNEEETAFICGEQDIKIIDDDDISGGGTAQTAAQQHGACPNPSGRWSFFGFGGQEDCPHQASNSFTYASTLSGGFRRLKRWVLEG